MKIGEAIQKSEPCSNNRNYGMQGFLYEIAGADPVVRVFRAQPALAMGHGCSGTRESRVKRWQCVVRIRVLSRFAVPRYVGHPRIMRSRCIGEPVLQ